MNYEELLESSRLESEEKASIVKGLEDEIGSPQDPLYIRILTGIGAWIAAIFMLGFLGVAAVVQNEVSAIFIGAILMAVAVVICRQKSAVFLEQLALALAFSGNMLLLFGLSEALHFKWGSIVVCHGVICGIMYPLFQNAVYRYLSPISVVVVAMVWILESDSHLMFHILIFIEVLVFSVLLFLRGLSSQLNPLFYASATALPCSLLFLNLSQTSTFRNPLELPMWPSSLIISMGLLLLFYHLFSGKKLLGSRWSVLAMISVVLLGVFTTPGVLVAIGLLVAGYAFYDRILSYLSYLFIPAFLVTFYYALNVDLACKSYVVTGSGVLLLLTRWLLCCWSRKVEA